jgi:hypothetical protein
MLVQGLTHRKNKIPMPHKTYDATSSNTIPVTILGHNFRRFDLDFISLLISHDSPAAIIKLSQTLAELLI